MTLDKAVLHLLEGDPLPAREWARAVAADPASLADLPAPRTTDPVARSLAAGLVEMLCARAGVDGPRWSHAVEVVDPPTWLARFARSHPALRARCEAYGPEALRRRGFFAMPGFLESA